MGILACGTIRPTRKDFPSLAQDKTLKRGDYDYRSTPTGITAYKWIDSKPVHFISNYHGVTATTVNRREKDGKKAIVSCPNVVKDYNNYMGGVDKHDQLRQVYGLDRKSVKWWHRIFFGLLDMSIVNVFVIYKESCPDEVVNIKSFKRELASGLLAYSKDRGDRKSPKRRKSNYSVPDSVRLTCTGIHWPKYVETRGRCEVYMC